MTSGLQTDRPILVSALHKFVTYLVKTLSHLQLRDPHGATFLMPTYPGCPANETIKLESVCVQLQYRSAISVYQGQTNIDNPSDYLTSSIVTSHRCTFLCTWTANDYLCCTVTFL